MFFSLFHLSYCFFDGRYLLLFLVDGVGGGGEE